MSSPTATPSDRVRFALVGAGVIGKHHGLVLSQLSDRVELVAVVDHHLDRAETLASERGGQPFQTLAAALAAVEVDVVIVCTPTGAHAEIAIEALDAGTHVVIEKPAEVTLAKTDAIIAAQRRAGTIVTVISQHRFDPATEISMAAIRAGELGRLTSGIASIDWWRGQSYYDSGEWRGTWELDGGGALMNQGVHTVDLLVASLGRPVEVFAYTATLAHERIETEDVAVGVVRFESGALGVLHASTAGYPGLSARLQVHGDRGSIVIDNDQVTYLHRTGQGDERRDVVYGENPADNQVASLGPGQGDAGSGTDPAQLGAAHRLQYENFLGALRGTEQVRVTLEENRRSIAVIVGAYESARTGRPVRLT